ncbi:MAG TPA: SIMPL domain-containing protein [Cytophagales bacterium]|nr:SIMPL domain-containing protein [Cytophagales bacterium]
MAKKIIFCCMLLVGFNAFSQNTPTATLIDNTRKIEVMGSAEMEVVPDEIYYTISLKEYKNNNKKVEIEALEKQLVKAVSAASIPKEDLHIENMQGYNEYWEKKRKSEDFLISKQYVLKLNNLFKINEIMSGVDPKGVAYTNISKYSHSKIEQFRKEIKIKALQAAREKAGYLLDGIDEELGEVLQIQEIGEYYPQPFESRMANMEMKAMSADEASPEIGFKEIKLRYEVRAVFKIK